MIGETHPTTILVNPRNQLIFDHLGNALHQLGQVFRMSLAYTINGQPTGDGEQRDHLAPRNLHPEELATNGSQKQAHSIRSMELTTRIPANLTSYSVVYPGMHALQFIAQLGQRFVK